MYQEMSEHIYVVKRNGERVPVSFDEILQRIRSLSYELDHVNPDLIAQKVCNQLMDGMKTSELDEFAAETCAMMQARYHPNYGKLAARIVISNHQKNTPSTLLTCTEALYHGPTQIVTDEYHDIVCNNSNVFQKMIDYSRDYVFDYFGFKTLEKGYLLKQNGVIVERPQHMWMRVAIQLHGNNIEKVNETYDALSQGYFIHATPTLFNSGTNHPQLSSCFLLTMKDDSISGIYKTLADCAQISKWSGGIGLSIHNIRARGSKIRGTNGESTGIVPMLRVFNDTAKYVNQGGKRNGSFAIYLEPWHADIEDFLRLKLNQGAEEDRARDLFYGLWIPDLFMKRLEQDKDWTLMCPDECPGLADCWGETFETLYESYEKAGKGRSTIPAKKLWQMILDAQIQTGTPYLCYKDAANSKSNQQHLGTIKSSNLCVAAETLVLTDKGEVPIQELVGVEDVRVYNGIEYSKVDVKQTGVDQKLLKITVDRKIRRGLDGGFDSKLSTLYCTEYHKFIVHEAGDSMDIKAAKRVEAKDLTPGTHLMPWTKLPTFENIMHLVVSVEDVGRYGDTYCFNEPINHAGVFNGILTGNCTEIMEYTSPDETAVCNLGSLALPKFVKLAFNSDCKCFRTTDWKPQHSVDCKKYNSDFENGCDPTEPLNTYFDFDKLRDYTRILTRNLDIVIDKNYYPTQECRNSNMKHRPIGIGVQGLADVFAMMRYPWSSDEAAKLNREIFENIYFAAMEASVLRTYDPDINDYKHANHELSITMYPTFTGSPLSNGKLQCDLWGDAPKQTPYLDWDLLRRSAKIYGARNSLLVAPMPTASTSQILGNNECFEPFTSNLYARRVLAGDFMVVNKYLVEDLTKLGLWTSDVRTQIVANNGSIQSIQEIPVDVRELYKTAWEIPQKTIINMARDRAPFICQSQSLNLFLAEPTYAKISSMHVYAWKQGLKTGCYYLRTKAVASAQKFTIEPPKKQDDCVMCSA